MFNKCAVWRALVWSVSVPLLITGCASTQPLSIPDTHPASAQAEESPLQSATSPLKSYKSFSRSGKNGMGHESMKNMDSMQDMHEGMMDMNPKTQEEPEEASHEH